MGRNMGGREAVFPLPPHGGIKCKFGRKGELDWWEEVILSGQKREVGIGEGKVG